MITSITSKNINNTRCEKCDFECSKLGDWRRHILTTKHLINNEMITQITSTHSANTYEIPSLFTTLTPSAFGYGSLQNIQKYKCSCGKEYKYQSGLSCHKKKCSIKKPINKLNLCTTESVEDDEVDVENDTQNNNLILEILKQNQEFKELMIEQNKYIMEQNKQNNELQKQMMELAKNAGNNTNCNNTNNNNNKFNMQFFLNETCKDAMSITEFIDSLELTFEDLENVGRVGYAEGISQIFIKGIRATEICKRPIHCSDIKRVVMFINDINGWEKDSNSNEKIIRLIKQIAKKNMKQASIWIAQHQDIVHGHGSKEQKQYNTMIGECFGGGTAEEDMKNYNKIIKRIASEIYIDKYKDV